LRIFTTFRDTIIEAKESPYNAISTLVAEDTLDAQVGSARVKDLAAFQTRLAILNSEISIIVKQTTVKISWVMKKNPFNQ
jgi:hypothetical protein